MSLVLTNQADKDQSIAVLDFILKHFMYPAVDPVARANLANHIAWMRRQSSDMKVDLRFETFPATKSTNFSFSVSFSNAPKTN